MNNKYTDKTFFNIIEIFGFKSSRKFVKTLQNSSWKERRRLKGPRNCILERQHKISPTTTIEQTHNSLGRFSNTMLKKRGQMSIMPAMVTCKQSPGWGHV